MGAYIIGMAIGSNWVMILCGIIGLLLAKKGAGAWVVYGIGVVLTALSVFGTITSESRLYGQTSSFSTAYLVCFILIAIIFAAAISSRRNRAAEDSAEDSGSDDSDPTV